MKITQITATNIPLLRARVNEILKPLAEEYGLKIAAGNASYSDENVTFKLSLATVSEDGIVQTQSAVDLKRYAYRHGLGEDALGKTFSWLGKTLTITGYKPRSRKYPILVKCKEDGTTYKYPLQTVKSALELAAK